MRRRDKLKIKSTGLHKYRSPDVEGNATYDVTSTLPVSQHRQIYPGGKSVLAQNEIDAEWVSGSVWTIWGKKNLFVLPGIEPRFLGHLARR